MILCRLTKRSPDVWNAALKHSNSNVLPFVSRIFASSHLRSYNLIKSWSGTLTWKPLMRLCLTVRLAAWYLFLSMMLYWKIMVWIWLACRALDDSMTSCCLRSLSVGFSVLLLSNPCVNVNLGEAWPAEATCTGHIGWCNLYTRVANDWRGLMNAEKNASGV